MIRARSSVFDARGGPCHKFNITIIQQSTHKDKLFTKKKKNT
jgi:hypothetical protein